MVEDRVSAHRGQNTGRKAEDQGEQHRAQRELDGGREKSGKLRQHRLPRDDGAAEVAVEDACDIAAILDEKRPVETEFPTQLLVSSRIDAALARHRLDRVSGDEADKKESQHGDPDKGRDRHADAGQREANHEPKGDDPPRLHNPIIA